MCVCVMIAPPFATFFSPVRSCNTIDCMASIVSTAFILAPRFHHFQMKDHESKGQITPQVNLFQQSETVVEVVRRREKQRWCRIDNL